MPESQLAVSQCSSAEQPKPIAYKANQELNALGSTQPLTKTGTETLPTGEYQPLLYSPPTEEATRDKATGNALCPTVAAVIS